MKLLMIIEHDNKEFKSVNYHTFTAARELSADIDVIIMGHDCATVIEKAKTLPSIKKIVAATAPEYAYQLSENIAPVIADIGKNYQAILAPATTFGKNLLPRVAALLDVSMISDVIKIISIDTFVRPIYAGNALTTVKSLDAIKLLTIRSTAFAPIASIENQSVEVVTLTQVVSNTLSEFIKHELTVSDRPELTSARIIISGGRGLKSADNFKLIEKVADRLGAAIGASRAAVDAGFAPNDYQVGQTGKIVAPDLYIAVGISGAIQHLAGMKESKVIVAINSDPEAPIFELADYGLVADLFKVLPELDALLEK